MIKRFASIYVLIVGLLAFAPALRAQSVAVSAHTTIVPGFGVLGECSTEADAVTAAYYDSVVTSCFAYSGNTLMGSLRCSGNPLAKCGNYFSPLRGVPSVTVAGNSLKMYDSDLFNPSPCPGYWYDPYQFGIPAPNPLPDITEQGIVPPFRGPYNCWLHNPADPDDGSLVGLAITRSNPLRLMEITPGTTTLFVGAEQTLQATKPAVWTLNGLGELKNTTPTSTVYKAPDSIPFDQVAFVKACNVTDPSDCDEADMNLEQVTVTVFPDNQELVQGETLKFSASMDPKTFDPTNAVTWSPTPQLGTFDANGLYTPPQNGQIQAGGVAVTVTAKSTKNQAVSGRATVYLAHVNTVDTIGSRLAMVADPSQTTSFSALANGPTNPHALVWSASPAGLGTLTEIPPNGAVFTPVAIPKEQVVTIHACMAGVCGDAPLTLVPFVRVASVTSPWNSGENNAIQIKGTGFGAHPQVSFSDPAIFFTPDPLQTDPDTLITGTVTTPVLTLPESVIVTVTNTASPVIPAPGPFTIKINPVVVTVSLSPTNATVPVGQSATFTPTVACKTAGGLPCPIPTSQTVTCTVKPPVGNVASGATCVYTAPSVSAQQVVQVVACSILTPTACGVTCTAPTCGIASVIVPPVNVTVSPSSATLTGGQKRQFIANVTNNPDTRVTWSIVPDPLVPADTPAGQTDQNGNYTAPNPVTVQQNIKVRATSQVDTSRYGDASVTLVPLIVSPGSVVRKALQTQTFSATTSGTPTSVDWSLNPNVAAAGSITPQGAYTAPPSLTTVTKVTVIATSKTDGSKGTAIVFLAAACYPRCRAVSHGAPAVVGQAYSGSVRDPDTDVPQGFIYTGNLPPNLTFATDTGAISGVPVQPPAVYGFSATPYFADGDGGTQLYAFPVCQSVSASPIMAGPFVMNNSYSIAYVPGSNPSGMFGYSAIGTLPPGMGLDASTGIVSGVPSAEGTYTYTIHTSLLPGVSAVFPSCPTGTSTDVTYQVTTSCDATCRIASLSPASLIFPSQTIGTTSPAQTITLQNSGSGRMLVNSITASGDFSVQSSSCGISLAPGANCVVNVTFTPTAAGTRTGALSVSDNSTGSPHVASLSGTGSAPAASLSPTSLAFAGQMLGTSSGSRSVMLTNSGPGALSITSITATGDFAQTNNCGSSLAANANCTINVTFTPTAVGLRTGTLSVSDNGQASPHTVSLSGAVVQGYHDVANCQGSAGWAWDSTQPNTPITVYIFDGNRLLDTVYANQYRPDLAGSYGNAYHGFTWTNVVSVLDGGSHNITVRFSPDPNSPALNNSPRSITCSPSVNALWIQPAALSWGQPNTLTIAGFAYGGVGTVALRWRDVTLNGPWNTVAYEAPTNPNDGSWSNTIASPDTCHVFQATVQYSGLTAGKDYDGLAQGVCSLHVIWVQPQSLAGFGPAGSLVVAGSATGGPSGSQVTLWFRDDTIGSGWSALSFAPLPDSTGIWYNAIPDVDYTHQYSVYVTYDNVNSGGCSYFGNGSKTNCP